MAHIATYIRASTDTQETAHQSTAIDAWLDEHDIASDDVDRYADLGHSGSDPGREQFSALIDAIETGQYEYVVVWKISRLARLGSIYQRFFECCEDAGTTVVVCLASRSLSGFRAPYRGVVTTPRWSTSIDAATVSIGQSKSYRSLSLRTVFHRLWLLRAMDGRSSSLVQIGESATTC